jgi:hypothetical protein
MDILILYAACAVYLYLLRPTIFSSTVEDTVNLLLPGFQGHVLQAGLIEEVRIAGGSFLPCISPFLERRLKNLSRYLPSKRRSGLLWNTRKQTHRDKCH